MSKHEAMFLFELQDTYEVMSIVQTNKVQTNNNSNKQQFKQTIVQTKNSSNEQFSSNKQQFKRTIVQMNNSSNEQQFERTIVQTVVVQTRYPPLLFLIFSFHFSSFISSIYLCFYPSIYLSYLFLKSLSLSFNSRNLSAKPN